MEANVDVHSAVPAQVKYLVDSRRVRSPGELGNQQTVAASAVESKHCACGNCACEEEPQVAPCTERCAVGQYSSKLPHG